MSVLWFHCRLFSPCDFGTEKIYKQNSLEKEDGFFLHSYKLYTMHTYVRTLKWHRENTDCKRKNDANIVVIYVWRKKTAECTSHQISAKRYCDKRKQRADTQALLSNHHKKEILHRIAKKNLCSNIMFTSTKQKSTENIWLHFIVINIWSWVGNLF